MADKTDPGVNEPIKVRIAPAATGRQVVRTSLPLPPGWLHSGQVVVAHHEGEACPTATRVLTWHPEPGPRSARRAMVTWVQTFADLDPLDVTLAPIAEADAPALPLRLPVAIEVAEQTITLAWDGGPVIEARLIAPEPLRPGRPMTQVVEDHGLYHWRRIELPDAPWPRVLELRVDALGQVVLVGHVRRDLPGHDYAPDVGWALDFRHTATRLAPDEPTPRAEGEASHSFDTGRACHCEFEDPPFVIEHPAAPFRRKGRVTLERNVDGRTRYQYWRAEAGDRTPMQQSAWLRFETVISPRELATPTPTLASPHTVSLDSRLWDALYDTGEPLTLENEPDLAALVDQHHRWMLGCMAVGDDLGNFTSFQEDRGTAAVFGMNRLNHGPPIFEQGWRSGDRRLVEAAVHWCDNFYEQSIWWGPRYTGGTRYNNGPSVDHHPPPDDPARYLWRSNRAINFCTKGYDAFFLAYEQTGDPRMLEALEAQVAFASAHIHTDDGECRNIGDVRDFVRLYRYTGEQRFLDQALRLFRELRTKVWDDGLFDQAGKPPSERLPFIDNDADGIHYGYAKPYIIGYALLGLPALLQYAPDEPRLREVVEAVAAFMVHAQDPAGGWRYPHPCASGLSLGSMEQAWQLVQADRALGADAGRLDAIERALRPRIHAWIKSGQLITGLTGWERATGWLEATGQTMAQLYASPTDRDPERDYEEGAIGVGHAAPEGLVYFPDVLRHYLQHRPPSRLLSPPAPDEPLGRVLARMPDKHQHQIEGVRDNLPVFHERAVERLTFPLAWRSCAHNDFARWRREARAKVMAHLLTPPPVATFAPAVLKEEDRGTHLAQRVAFNLTGDSRVLAHLLRPKGDGPFPAVLLLHDHGARFDIGKEKVTEPFDDQGARIESARQWIEQCYGNRFIGDELARRGYVCLATDMLNWSDRGGGGYEAQQALAANLMHLGMSFAGLIAHEDQRAAEFLATRPEVDTSRVAAVGLSVGGYRAWQVAALSDRIRAAAAVCWMATIPGQMQPGVNQTAGQSAFSMVHPGLGAYLDFPDIASLACPKPMLFYNGLQDGLFDVEDVRRAYAIMRHVWDSQDGGDRLHTRLWDVPHMFDQAMQETAFDWLEMWAPPTPEAVESKNAQALNPPPSAAARRGADRR